MYGSFQAVLGSWQGPSGLGGTLENRMAPGKEQSIPRKTKNTIVGPAHKDTETLLRVLTQCEGAPWPAGNLFSGKSLLVCAEGMKAAPV